MKIGGEAGQGIQTIGDSLAKVFSRTGYHVFTHQEYESRIRGGHNIYQIRFSDVPVTSSKSTIDIIVALDRESIDAHEPELSAQGIIVYDQFMLKETYTGDRFFNIPLLELAEKHGRDKIMANTVAVGAVLGMLGLGTDVFFGIIEDTLRKKGDEVINLNKDAFLAGYEFAVQECLQCAFTVKPQGEPRMLIGVNEAIGLGAIASGCKFYSAYPMTPSTGIMLFIAGKAKEYGIVVEQAEDEIAAINMAIGASYAGVRSMTGTSGGGFALMVEGLSLAAMTETPIVIALAQRPAPATGLPTKTEQGDLLFALYAGHGEFPRVIFAPGSPEQAFYLTNKAFDISQRYQIPVFILTDQYLSDSQWTEGAFDINSFIHRDYRIRGDSLEEIGDYKRHAYTEDGISPFGIPGTSTKLIVTDSDEHDEEGHITEDPETRIMMVDKRLFKKMPLIKKEISPPLFYGDKDPDIVLVGWGSTYGVIKEAVDIISRHNKAAMIHFSEVYPLPSTEKMDYIGILRGAKKTICIENNATSQFSMLIKSETGYEFTHHINRFDGRPFFADLLARRIDDIH
ncbi:MAG TPA: 2-oxoacid:acceptor oxidoreductase subunit alpha [Syntrophorhabdaceae bacterium]|nr:2-oxoacid:acceptor oxidoreductase subunit alpha [Syntrophorhabdaceae bacterium]HQK47130.1 2-oxoacid:acceptor oxidoreductase subunit alpha [Syntrophorhabdaceae bacterium]